jgi:hypothetical protein
LVRRLTECGSTVVAEIEVDAGPPSHERYRGTVIHDWSADSHLVRYRLYVGDTARPDVTNFDELPQSSDQCRFRCRPA